MAEVVLSLPQLCSVCLDLPYVLFKLAEQITPDNQETMMMTVTGRHGSSVKVTLQKTTHGEEERLLMAITDSNNEDIIRSDGDNWRIELGSVQSPVYLQKDTINRNSSDAKPVVSTMQPAFTETSSQQIESVTTGVNTCSMQNQEITEPELQAIQESNDPVESTPTTKSDNSPAKLQEALPDTGQEIENDIKHEIVISDDTGNVTYATDNKFTEIVVPEESMNSETLLESRVLESLLRSRNFTVISQSEDQNMPIIDHSQGQNTAFINQSEGQKQIMHQSHDQESSLDSQSQSQDLPHQSHDQDSPPVGQSQCQDLPHQSPSQSQNIMVLNESLCNGSTKQGEEVQESQTIIVHKAHDPESDDEQTVQDISQSVIILEPQDLDGGEGLENFVVLNEPMEIEEENNVTQLLAPTEWWQGEKAGQSVDTIGVKTETTEGPCDNTVSSSQNDSKQLTQVTLESSFQIQSTKDIPKIMVDITAFRCSICQKVFNSLKQHSSHFSLKHGEVEYDESAVEQVLMKDMYLCFICQQPFRRYHSIHKHLESVHKMDMEKRKIIRLLACPICGSKHSSHHTLRCHLNYKHSKHPELNQHLVNIQNQAFNLKSSKKPASVLLQCPWCQLHLNLHHFRHHLNTAHSGEGNMKQVLADASAAMKDMKRERQSSRTKACHICQQEFPLTRYYSHMRRVHQFSSKPMNNKCGVCGKVLGSSWHLKLHMDVHTDSRNFECEKCGQKFRNKYALRSHMKVIHQGVYRHRCDACGHGFHTPKTLAHHRCAKAKTKSTDQCHKSEDPDPANTAEKATLSDTDMTDDQPFQIEGTVLVEVHDASDIENIGEDMVYIESDPNTETQLENSEIYHNSEHTRTNISKIPHKHNIHSVLLPPADLDKDAHLIHVIEPDSPDGSIEISSSNDLPKRCRNESAIKETPSGSKTKQTPKDFCQKHTADGQNQSTKDISPNKENRTDCTLQDMNPKHLPHYLFPEQTTKKEVHHSERAIARSPSPNHSPDQKQRPDVPIQKDQIELTEWGSLVCKVCRKEFSTRMGVCTHLRRVHRIGKKPIKQFECKICGKQFMLQSKLTMHQLTHEDKSEKCSLCGSTYTNKYGLRRHIKVVHHGEYNFYCDKCGRGFQKRTYQRSHDCSRPGRRSGGRFIMKTEPQGSPDSGLYINNLTNNPHSSQNHDLQNFIPEIQGPQNNGSESHSLWGNNIKDLDSENHCDTGEMQDNGLYIKRDVIDHEVAETKDSIITVLPCAKKDSIETTVVIVTRPRFSPRHLLTKTLESAHLVDSEKKTPDINTMRKVYSNSTNTKISKDRSDKTLPPSDPGKTKCNTDNRSGNDVKDLKEKESVSNASAITDIPARSRSSRSKSKPSWLQNYDN